MQTRLADVAAAYPGPDEVRRAYLQNADAMRQIESAVLEKIRSWTSWPAKAKGVADKPGLYGADRIRPAGLI